MVAMIFWEKPRCAGSVRQKALLRANGHTLEVRNLRAEACTSARLASFLGDRHVGAWFSPRPPRAVSGEVQLESLTEGAALALLFADPLQIGRPLGEVGGGRTCGLDPTDIVSVIGVPLPEGMASEAFPFDANVTRCA